MQDIRINQIRNWRNLAANGRIPVTSEDEDDEEVLLQDMHGLLFCPVLSSAKAAELS